MAHPTVGQTPLLAKLFGDALDEFKPRRIALAGCATGNGLDRVDPGRVERVLALDINPEYLALTAARYSELLDDRLYLRRVDLADALATGEAMAPGGFDLIHAALIFEYVDPALLLPALAAALDSGGVLTVLLQLPTSEQAPVSETPFEGVRILDSVLNLVPPDHFAAIAKAVGLFRLRLERHKLVDSGKEFELSFWRRG
jgi:SAM-dependent methyltransferase